MTSHRGPILIIDDDSSDAESMVAAIRDLKVKHEIRHFPDARTATDFLMATTEQPLVIISDIRMPGQDGISLLRHIQHTELLRKKAIPFVFLSGIVRKDIVTEAYNLGVQGFYQKASTYEGIKEQLYFILSYWMRCIHPGTPALN